MEYQMQRNYKNLKLFIIGSLILGSCTNRLEVVKTTDLEEIIVINKFYFDFAEYKYDENKLIEQMSSDGLIRFGSISTSYQIEFQPVRDTLSIFQMAGYTPNLKYDENIDYLNGYIIGVMLTHEGKEINGDELFIFENNDVYIKPGFTGEITLNISQYPKVLETIDVSKLTYYSKHTNGVLESLEVEEAINKFKAAGYTPELNFENQSTFEKGFVVGLMVIEDNLQINGDKLLYFNGEDIYIKPGFQGRIVLNINSYKVHLTPEENGWHYLGTYVDGVGMDSIDAYQAIVAFQAAGYQPIFSFLYGSDIHNGILSGFSPRKNGEYLSGDVIIGYMDGKVYVKPGFEGEIEVSFKPRDMALINQTHALFGKLGGNFIEPVLLSDALAAFLSMGYEPKVEYGNLDPKNPNLKVNGAVIYLNGFSVSGDYLFLFLADEVRIRPNFEGEIILVAMP